MSVVVFFQLILPTSAQEKPTPFKDVSASSGIDHIFEVYEGTFGGGVVVFDFNNDGWEDLFITGGVGDDQLYLNKGDGTFENVYEGSGLKTPKKYVTQGAISADVNRDGWRDLFVTTIKLRDSKDPIPRAENLLFINNGDGTFRNATEEFGLDRYQTFSTGAMFGDINNDGYPDIFVGNYFNMFDGKLHIMNDAIIVGSNQMAEGLLLINKKGKSFENQYEKYGLGFKGFGFGGVFSDYDNDGDLDLIVNHDFGYKSIPNQFFQNQYPKARFLDIADSMDMDLPINGMGLAVGDYNNDGYLDYYFTNIRANPFMVNQGPGKPFLNQNEELGIKINMIREKGRPSLPISWGANFADFNHNTNLELFVANGALNPEVFPIPNYYFELENGTYVNKASEKGVNDRGLSRGSVVFDYDNDGDLDLLVINQYPVNDGLTSIPSSLLYRNDASEGNWVKVALQGRDTDLNGIGSRVEVVIGDLTMIREIDGGSSHLSQNSVIAHFGLGDAEKVDTVRVKWLGGGEQVMVNQQVNQLLSIEQVPSARFPYVWLLALLIATAVILFFLKQRKPLSD
ncbi:CRTAC1 family protein [Pleomorphovibrio marinus]|uniref:CRTAC1 family protein n=1 Tax=Pleomorphovibrio marinus TaxID=2164132 RepID=UPI000E0BAF69|nr:CRTAC1 family protein [Pleomorphovibrio marinus]